MKTLPQLSRLVAFGFVAALAMSATADEWTHLAGDAARSGISGAAPRDLSEPSWVAAPLADEEFVWLSTPLVCDVGVFLTARRFVDMQHTANRVIAFDIATGERLWTRLIAPDALQSWSSPVLLLNTGRLVIGSADTLYALDVNTGVIAWETRLDALSVNASPVAADGLLRNGTPVNRVITTDHVPHGIGHLYGVNVSPFDAQNNPYQPGQIVWRSDIPGSSGSTPAFDQGAVIVASGNGSVYAFDAIDGRPLWTTAAAAGDGFFGGVTIRDGFVYAATYNFDGGENNSRLVKLNAADGRLIWTTASERTDAIPIVTAAGRIYLSAGIAGFGSAVKVQAFEDFGSSAALIWDTQADTQGELTVGGWTHQPVYADGLLYAGVPSGSGLFDAYAELLVLDVSLNPADAGFVVSRGVGAGGSAAVAHGALYSVGVDGLSAFTSCDACDMNCDGQVDAFDVEPFLGLLFGGDSPCRPCTGDTNADGAINAFDIEPFLSCLFP